MACGCLYGCQESVWLCVSTGRCQSVCVGVCMGVSVCVGGACVWVSVFVGECGSVNVCVGGGVGVSVCGCQCR